MKSIGRTITTMLVAVAALAVVASASASAALPEFSPAPAKKKFTDTGGQVSVTWGEWQLQCAKSSATGEVTSARTLGKVVITWTGCKNSANEGATYCSANSTGAKEGEIITKSLSGELGTATEASSGVGLRLTPETGSSLFTMVRNGCLTEGIVSGSLVSEVGVVGKKQATNEFIFKLASGKQAIKSITLDSGEVAKPSLTYLSSDGTIAWKDAVSFEEALEVT
jgi:hypothetical protein